jgi:hypothetical protein
VQLTRRQDQVRLPKSTRVSDRHCEQQDHVKVGFSGLGGPQKITPPDAIQRGDTTSRLSCSPEKGKYHFKEVLTVEN